MKIAAPANGGTPTRAGQVRAGLVGQGIRASRTPGMHEAEGRAQGLAYRYDLIDLDRAGDGGSLSKVVAQAEAKGFAGLNITYPYKQAIIALTDHRSDAARRVGAVNTVVFRDGKRFGHNTDFWGFSESFRRGMSGAPHGAVLLIGAGGAGGAIAHALQDLGVANLMIADILLSAAKDLADSVNASAGAQVARAVEDIAEAAALADGIVNATPMGMARLPGTPLDMGLVTPNHWVADIVYFPLETEFLRGARACGCRTLDGSGMAVFQAVRAFHLFTGLEADADRMRAAFNAFGAA